MQARMIGIIAVLVALSLAMPAPLSAQPAPPPPAGPLFTAPQLDQLLAPVALYPDDLLQQILIASTYPLEVVEAWRWRQSPENAALADDALAAALEAQDWDPSVKALVPFPGVLQMMNDRLDWIQQLGDAFLALQGDVMDTIQRLRREARNAGTLVSTPQQVVSDEGQTIVVAPANPAILYPPYYDPTMAYGYWPDPDYPPYEFPPPQDYEVGPALFFGLGVAIVPSLWGWDRFDWARRRIHIDTDRYNRIDRAADQRTHRPPATNETWQHDPYHRQGVAYRDPAARARLTPSPPGSPEQRRVYRGYEAQEEPPAAVLTQPVTLPQVRTQTPTVIRPPAVIRLSPPAFEDVGRGQNIRNEALRGEQSLRSATPLRAPAAVAPRGGGRVR
jgi:hypothetical protein